MKMSREGIYQDRDGQSFSDIDLCHRDGRALAHVRVRTAGHTHTGVASFVVVAEGLELVYSDGSWDCREWQWWKAHGLGDEKWPRMVPATSGYAEQGTGMCVTSEYTCDDIQTQQEWFFQLQDSDDVLTYDCRQTIRNCNAVDRVEYAQFFACYTEINKDKSQFYWAKDKQFRSFESVDGRHLDAYIVAPESTFESLGVIPYALRGEGKVADTWYRPVLVGHPSPKGWRHIVLTEPATTAGLASGMGGIAMDYIVYPGTDTFKSDETFSTRIRHHIVRMPESIDISMVEGLWEIFERDLLA